MGIALCHNDGFVPEGFLQEIQVASGHNPLRGEGVPQIVKMEIAESRTVARVFESIPHTFELRAVCGCEYQIRIRVTRIVGKQIDNGGISRNMPRLSILTVPNEN